QMNLASHPQTTGTVAPQWKPSGAIGMTAQLDHHARIETVEREAAQERADLLAAADQQINLKHTKQAREADRRAAWASGVQNTQSLTSPATQRPDAPENGDASDVDLNAPKHLDLLRS
ncbi:MAG TPA: hypothetical protein VEC99_00310, partial [Clostridia bacterium]|nr:hypothetical protein [Clostridia bacterium]